MMFLLAKMLLLLILAAAAGAALAWWWFRRHYEDVTLEYARSREDFLTWRDSFEERLAARPEVDLGPLREQIADLHLVVRDLPAPEPVDLAPLQARLEALHERFAQLRLPPPADLAPVDARLTAIEHALFPLQTRLDELSAAVRALRPSGDAGVDEPPAPAAPEPDTETPAARNLLSHPTHGQPDDLTRIRGVPKVLEQTLHKVGVFYFWQIAEWSAEDVAYVDSQLERFRGRIERDAWIDQASELAQAPEAASRPDAH